MVANISSQVLVDSDAFIAWIRPDDILHSQASDIFRDLQQRRTQLVTTSMVVMETATVLSHRDGQAIATRFLDLLDQTQLPMIYLDEGMQRETLALFRSHNSRGISAVDCANIVVMKRLEIEQIFSFDKFYSNRIDMKTYLSTK
jgi:predicted nucleic acid-binding protein